MPDALTPAPNALPSLARPAALTALSPLAPRSLAPLLALLPLSLLAACDGGKAEPCEEPPTRPAMDACIGGFAVEVDQTTTFSASVTVLSIGQGAFPDTCAERIGPGESSTGTWMTVTDSASNTYTLGLAVDGLDLAAQIAEGDPLFLTLDYTPGSFSASTGNLRLDSGAGTFLAWVGMGGELSALTPPTGFTLQQSVVTCETEDACGAWQDHAVFIKTATQTVEVDPGGTADIGGTRFLYGGDRQSGGAAEDGTTCPDWFVSASYAAALPEPG